MRRSIVIAMLALCVAAPVGGESLKRVLDEQVGADKDAAGAQAKIETLDDQAQDMAGKYRDSLAIAASMGKYADQLAVQIKSQDERLAEIKGQLAEIEVTQRDVLPLMERMIETLDRFVSLDVPFLPEERRKRVETLKGLIGRADVSTSEKYRRVLEAYQIEMEYGRTLDAYTGKLGDGEEARTVQFVRLGRVALMYQTLDGEETGYWDAGQKEWVVDNSYAHDLKRTLSVAKKEGAPDLVMVPIPAPVEVKQ